MQVWYTTIPHNILKKVQCNTPFCVTIITYELPRQQVTHVGVGVGVTTSGPTFGVDGVLMGRRGFCLFFCAPAPSSIFSGAVVKCKD